MRFVKTAENLFGLPSNFTRVEYLESTGTQYIDTGYIASNTSGFSVKIMPLQSTDKYFIGSRPRTSTNDRFLAGSITGPQVYIGWNTNTYASWELNKVHTVQNNFMNSRTKDLDGTVVAQISETLLSQGTRTVYLFSANDASVVSMDTCRIYKVQISEGLSLVRDMIPCIDPLGRACMYDLVGKKAYYNEGTGEFTVGRQVIPVNYLESTGTQYIDTGYVPKPTSSYKCEFELTSIATTSGAWFCVFGSVESNNSVFTELFLPRASGGGDVNQVLVGNHNSTYIRKDYAWAANTSYDFEMTTTDVFINGVSQGSITVDSSVTCSHSVYLFARHEYNDAIRYNVGAKIYSFKIVEGNTLVRDFIPCKDENNVGFMFDTVSGTVYENAGTGAFTVGNNKYKMKLRLIKDNILPTGYTQLEYIEATNSGTIEYAVGNYRLTDTTDWEITFTASAPNNNWVMGQPTWIGVHYRKDTTTSNLPRVGITNSASTASQCYVDYTDNEKITLALKGTDVYANGVKAGSITRVSAGATQTKYGIFAYKDINQELPNLRIQSARIYRLKIWDNDVLVQDLIPAMKDGIAGFYERVNKTFIKKESNSTSDFTTGKPILPMVRFPVDPDPVGYKIVNYLESSGTQYIDTGFKPNPATTKIECAFCGFSGGSTQMFGARTVASSSNENNTNICFGPVGGKIYIRGDWIRQNNNLVTDIEPEEYIHLIAHNQTVSINGTEYSSTLEKNNTYLDYNFCLFACNTAGTIQFYSKIRQYYFKIYDNNTLVRSFIPVIRLLDNKAGMWDTVTKQFYTTPVGDFITG